MQEHLPQQQWCEDFSPQGRVVPESVFALKEEISFFNFFEAQCGHTGFSFPRMSSSKVALHLEHLYSKIGIVNLSW